MWHESYKQKRIDSTLSLFQINTKNSILKVFPINPNSFLRPLLHTLAILVLLIPIHR